MPFSEEEALQILSDLHGRGDKGNELVQLEYEEIRAQVHFERNEGAKSYLDLLKPGIVRRVTLGASLQMWSQLSGMNIMMYYIIYVFQGAGLTGRRGNLIADSVQYVLNVVFTSACTCVTQCVLKLINRTQSRPSYTSTSGVAGRCSSAARSSWASSSSSSAAFKAPSVTGAPSKAPAIPCGSSSAMTQLPRVSLSARTSLCAGNVFPSASSPLPSLSAISLSSFAITMGPVSWTYPAEIFPMRVRAKAVSVSTATNWLFNFALAWAVPPGLSTIAYRTYFIFGTFNLAAFVHIFFMFPETAGRTLEEIEDVFGQGHVFTAWKVKRGVGQRTLEQAVAHRKQVDNVHEDEYQEKASV
jgi:hypothetical protein